MWIRIDGQQGQDSRMVLDTEEIAAISIIQGVRVRSLEILFKSGHRLYLDQGNTLVDAVWESLTSCLPPMDENGYGASIRQIWGGKVE